jgi:hypothetical protein
MGSSSHCLSGTPRQVKDGEGKRFEISFGTEEAVVQSAKGTME